MQRDYGASIMILPLLLIAISPMDSIFAAVERNYSHISAPDSTVPVPETRLTDRIAPDTQSYYRDSSYMVIRTDTTFDLFSLNTDLSIAKNTHVHPMWHSHAHKADGKWIWDSRPRPYTGYDAKDLLKDECELDPSLPCHVFIGAWRILNAPFNMGAGRVHIKVLHADRDSVVVAFGDSTREWRKP